MILETRDGVRATADKNTMMISNLLRTVAESFEEDDMVETEIPLPNVDGHVLDRIIEYCKYHYVEPMKTIPRPLPPDGKLSGVIQTWYVDFIESFATMESLYELIQAAHYMDIAPLQELGCARIANLIRGKEPGEIKQILGL